MAPMLPILPACWHTTNFAGDAERRLRKTRKGYRPLYDARRATGNARRQCAGLVALKRRRMLSGGRIARCIQQSRPEIIDALRIRQQQTVNWSWLPATPATQCRRGASGLQHNGMLR